MAADDDNAPWFSPKHKPAGIPRQSFAGEEVWRLHDHTGQRCFVAMSFDASLKPAFDIGIQPAVAACGFVVDRVDQQPHNGDIIDRIRSGIRSAQVLVADFTLQRPGVYYEAGLAEGLGRTVIRTCRADDFDKLHFDTRQFLHLKWSTGD